MFFFEPKRRKLDASTLVPVYGTGALLFERSLARRGVTFASSPVHWPEPLSAESTGAMRLVTGKRRLQERGDTTALGFDEHVSRGG